MSQSKTDVLDAYQIWARRYDNDAGVNPAIVAERNRLIRFLLPKETDVILEIGCGTGRLTIPISKRCTKIVGVDFSEKMLKVAREKSKKCENIEYRKIDARKGLPFKDRYFDKVIGPLVINHIENPNGLFKEVHRVLKNRGLFVFDNVNPDGYVFPAYRDPIFQLSQRGKKIFFHHTVDSFVNGLHKTGFELERIKFTRIDETIKQTLTKATFQKNKGRTFGVIICAKKDRCSFRISCPSIY